MFHILQENRQPRYQSVAAPVTPAATPAGVCIPAFWLSQSSVRFGFLPLACLFRSFFVKPRVSHIGNAHRLTSFWFPAECLLCLVVVGSVHRSARGFHYCLPKRILGFKVFSLISIPSFPYSLLFLGFPSPSVGCPSWPGGWFALIAAPQEETFRSLATVPFCQCVSSSAF